MTFASTSQEITCSSPIHFTSCFIHLLPLPRTRDERNQNKTRQHHTPETSEDSSNFSLKKWPDFKAWGMSERREWVSITHVYYHQWGFTFLNLLKLYPVFPHQSLLPPPLLASRSLVSKWKRLDTAGTNHTPLIHSSILHSTFFLP